MTFTTAFNAFVTKIENNFQTLLNSLNGKAAFNHTHSQYLTEHQDISGKVDKTSIVSSVSSSSTNTQVVGAKLFYDTVGNIETLLSEV